MEMLHSTHLQGEIFNVMRTSYNIYNSVGFIGFCVIYHHQDDLLAHLLLFEEVSVEDLTKENYQPDSGKSYPLKTSDAQIIRDLMSDSIPLFGKNGQKYVANNDNATYNIE